MDTTKLETAEAIRYVEQKDHALLAGMTAAELHAFAWGSWQIVANSRKPDPAQITALDDREMELVRHQCLELGRMAVRAGEEYRALGEALVREEIARRCERLRGVLQEFFQTLTDEELGEYGYVSLCAMVGRWDRVIDFIGDHPDRFPSSAIVVGERALAAMQIRDGKRKWDGE